MSDKARKFPKTLMIVDDNNADDPFFSIVGSYVEGEESGKGGLVATYQLVKIEKCDRLIHKKEVRP